MKNSFDTILMSRNPDSWIEIHYPYARVNAPKTIRIKMVRDESGRFFRYIDQNGDRVLAQQLEELLLSPGSELRIHDGVHEAGTVCRFLFRGVCTRGVFT